VNYDLAEMEGEDLGACGGLGEENDGGL